MLPITATGQTADELIDRIAADMEADGQLDDDATERLAEMRAHAEEPTDINKADEEGLARLFFLSPNKIRGILRHRRLAGGFLTQQELLSVAGLSGVDVLNILDFVEFGAPEHTEPLHYVKAEGLGRLQVQMPRARGFRHYYRANSDSLLGPTFRGNPFKTLLRLRGEADGHYRFGLTTETDAGEPRFSGGTRGPDFITAYGCYDGNGLVRRAIVGSYSLRVGLGLGLGTGLGFSATSTGVSNYRQPTGLMPSASAAEGGQLCGAAIDMELGPARLLLFGSRTREDGTVHTDSETGRQYIQSLRADGLHRTDPERQHRHNIPTSLLGLYVRTDAADGATEGGRWALRAGMGFNTWHSAYELRRSGRMNAAGLPNVYRVSTLHADYRAFCRRATLYGEAAFQGPKAWGATQGLGFEWANGAEVCVAARRFGPAYRPVAQNPEARWAAAAGEGGIYVGAGGRLRGVMNVRGSVDFYRHHWERSNVEGATWGMKIRAQAERYLGRMTRLDLQVRHVTDDAPSRDAFERERTTALKATVRMEPGRIMKLRTVGGWTIAQKGEGPVTGILIGEAIRAEMGSVVRLDVAANYFNAPDYAARVYAQLPAVLYDMGFRACSGRGMLSAAVIKVSPVPNVSMWATAQWLHRQDTDKIGSSHDETEGANRWTFKVQVRVKVWKRERREFKTE